MISLPHSTAIVAIAALLLANACTQEAKTANSAIVPAQKLENDFYDWHQRHEEAKKVVESRQADLIFIGDSITHMFGGEPKSNKTNGGKVWQEFYGKRNVINLGFGWDRTQNVLWRLENGEFAGQTPRAVVLLIGTNNFSGTKNARENTPAEVVEGVTAICDKIHAMSPKTTIVLLGILPRGGSAQDPIRAKIAAANQKLAELDARPEVEFVDLTVKLLQPDGSLSKEMMPDFVHPSEKAYRVWAETIEPRIAALLGESPSSSKP